MCNPIAQDYFGPNRNDDPGIDGPSRLLRHCRTPVQIVPCEVHGYRVSSQAFVTRKGEAGTSVDLSCLLEQDGLPDDHRFGLMPNTLALIEVTADEVRERGLGAAWTPKPEEPHLDGAAREANPWHGEIIGVTRSASRDLAAIARTIRSES